MNAIRWRTFWIIAATVAICVSVDLRYPVFTPFAMVIAVCVGAWRGITDARENS